MKHSHFLASCKFLNIYLICSLSIISITVGSSQALGTGTNQTPICNSAKSFEKESFIISIGDRLLTKPEFNYYWGISEEDKRYMLELKSIIKKFNLNIITLPIPYQAALYIDSSNNPAPKKYDPTEAVKFYQAQIKNLRDHNLNPIDLNEVAKHLPKDIDFFAKRDHHWTGPAMEAAAGELKKLIDKLNLGIDHSSQTFLTRSVRDYNGSAADQLKSVCGYSYPSQEQRTFFDLSIKSSESLLGVTSNEVVMVGDSYSISYFGFDKVVSDQLKTPVLNMSINGGGCCGAINGYFANLKPKDEKPKVLIWTALMVLTNANQVRELKPSIYQAYENISSLKIVDSTTSKLNIYQFDTKLDKNARYFIKLNVDGPKTENLNFILNYKTNTEDISLSRTNENQNVNYVTPFFYELKPGQDMLTSLKIKSPTLGNITVSLFKYK